MNIENKVSIQFLGAAGTVTGSKYFIKTSTKNILVDCGMFQGLKALRLLNWEVLPIDVTKIDVVLITHGHLDHVGYLPRLVKAGFTGKIMASEPTVEVAEIILRDSAHIQEEDAERANKGGYSKHTPALPLYDLKDVENTIPHFSAVPLDKWINLDDDIMVRYRYNGHIIGATFIELKIKEKVFVFSGDVGREKDLLMAPPEKPLLADVLFIESTYGNKIHPENSEEKLIQVINETYNKQGTIVIPGFALERIQLLMYMIWKLKNKKAIPDIPIYMDSPMARRILEVFINNKNWHKIPIDEFKEMCTQINLVEKMEDTIKTASKKQPKIIIAGSGMATGGRVLTYLQYYLSDAASTVMLVGYQAEGTRGRKMLEGDEEIKIYGKYYKVKARIANIEGMSAHADQNELINWMSEIKHQPEKIFIVHGEKDGALGLKNKIKEIYNWDAEIPQLNDVAEIKF